MSGICGYVGRRKDEHDKIIDKMLLEQRHRGPDCLVSQIKYLGDKTIALGYNKLSIKDDSATVTQLTNLNELTIVLDGRIYNYVEIKKELTALGHTFVSDDKEAVILHSFQEWGCACVHRFIGMFVFVIIDSAEGIINIFRDRAGVRPLFYYFDNEHFIFASELKSFHCHPGFHKKINLQSVDLFMKFGNVPAPNCIFENSYKLDAGNYLTYNIKSHRIELQKYWSIFECYAKPKLLINYEDAKVELEKILKSAFFYRMSADTPIGLFLSGGYDSSAVASILQKDMTDRLKTFTIGFHIGNNEAPYACMIAKYLGTDHTEYYCTEKDAKEIIMNLPFYFDEPFADSSAIPTSLVSKIARKDVRIALSADGGDEIFAGYDTYRKYVKNISTIKKIPSFAHPTIAYLFKSLQHIYPNRYQKIKRGFNILEDVFKAQGEQQMKRMFFGIANNSSVFYEKNMYSDSGFEPQRFVFDTNETDVNDYLSFSMSMDYYMLMHNDVLTKVDRATQSVSLESREPFLDHRIVEFVAKLPNDYKINKNNTKIILKDVVHNYLPETMMNRPKTGFVIPIYKWLRGDLKDYLNDCLTPKIVNDVGIFNQEYVSFVKELFMNDKLHDKVMLWKLLMFHTWANRWLF